MMQDHVCRDLKWQKFLSDKMQSFIVTNVFPYPVDDFCQILQPGSYKFHYTRE